MEILLMFDGKNSLKDITKFLSSKFKKLKLVPTIEKDGITKTLKESKEQEQYFKDAVEALAKYARTNYLLENIL
ncbi:hypothetical protein [Campylobacter fetus]|nr:hypothetical protein [Campylobacter fetus]KAA3683171.1 hypothetical protein E3G72_07330 [Campylobacter fetus subsp. fetus]